MTWYDAVFKLPQLLDVDYRKDRTGHRVEQRPVLAILDEADLLLVIGSDNSSNSRRMVDVATRAGTSAHLVDGPQHIAPDWLQRSLAIPTLTCPPRSSMSHRFLRPVEWSAQLLSIHRT